MSSYSKILALTLVAAANAKCVKFSEAYSDARDFVENGPWAGAFIYETDSSMAYEMWFETADNPNDAMTVSFINAGKINNTDGHLNSDGHVDKCFLDYLHKNLSEAVDNSVHPTSNPEDFDICTPWADRSCCTHDTVSDIAAFDQLFSEWYGLGGDCGPVSAGCRQYFIEEECFYSCEPNAGLFRKYLESDDHPVSHAGQVGPGANGSNTWEMSGMPLNAAYWDAFYMACKDDTFCDWSEPCGTVDSMAPSSGDSMAPTPGDTMAPTADTAGAATASCSLALLIAVAFSM